MVQQRWDGWWFVMLDRVSSMKFMPPFTCSFDFNVLQICCIDQTICRCGYLNVCSRYSVCLLLLLLLLRIRLNLLLLVILLWLIMLLLAALMVLGLWLYKCLLHDQLCRFCINKWFILNLSFAFCQNVKSFFPIWRKKLQKILLQNAVNT